MSLSLDTLLPRPDALRDEVSDTANRSIDRIQHALSHHQRALRALASGAYRNLPDVLRSELIQKLRRDAASLRADLQRLQLS